MSPSGRTPAVSDLDFRRKVQGGFRVGGYGRRTDHAHRKLCGGGPIWKWKQVGGDDGPSLVGFRKILSVDDIQGEVEVITLTETTIIQDDGYSRIILDNSYFETNVKMEKIAQLNIRKLVDDLCSRIETIKLPRTNQGIDIVLGGYGIYGLKAYLITKNNHDSNEVYGLCVGVREILRKEVVVLGPELVVVQDHIKKLRR
ncbi:hypothetical protein OROGR_013943 [Orobanche gracilis]